MRQKLLVSTLIIEFLLLLGPNSAKIIANPLPGEEKEQVIYSLKVKQKPKLDGILDDKVWQTEPIKKEFISYNPLFGDILPYKTLVWTSFDDENLYFAFLCLDSEPQNIKASYTKRDDMFNDDWVGLSLDALGTRQTAYALFVNPLGIQGDFVDTAVSGSEFSPDFIWESAAKITEQGYQVEICLPLKSINFKSGKNVKMGILFWRQISRLGYIGSWPQAKPGQGVFNTHTRIIYEKLKNPLKLELLPNITSSNNRERLNARQWGDSEAFTELGMGIRYGITSAITADITINPDFSQVESDAFQVKVNRRYPLFYSEKRPFFMEGIGIFSFFTIPNGFLPNAVHTRRIIDPLWGAKLTGTIGKTTFGIISAADEWPGQISASDSNPNEGKNAFFGIARGKYSLDKDNYFGILYSGREFAGEYNRVFGADFGYRLFRNHKINASFLQSMSGKSPNSEVNHSSDFNLYYTYITKIFRIKAAFEHIGKDFRLDSSYLKRTGVNEGWGSMEYNFHPDRKKISWLKRITPKILFQYLHDLNTGMNDSYLNLSLNFNFIKQGYLRINYFAIKESWKVETFDLEQFNLSGEVQLTKWMRLRSQFTWGEKIYYTAEPSYKGKGYDGSFSLVFQPNENLSQYFSFSHSDLFKNKEKLYDVNIFFSHTSYQFSKYFFLRAVLQYNNYQKQMLTDFLASFTLIPGTVMHVGYGGLYESREWQDNKWLYRQGDLLNIKRSFFLKVSYLWRF
jgi:hypothetical protein